MQKGIVGKKLGMTQLFDANGNVVPVTVIEAGPCAISQKKTKENDGYEAVQVGFGDLKATKTNKPMKRMWSKLLMRWRTAFLLSVAVSALSSWTGAIRWSLPARWQSMLPRRWKPESRRSCRLLSWKR